MIIMISTIIIIIETVITTSIASHAAAGATASCATATAASTAAGSNCQCHCCVNSLRLCSPPNQQFRLTKCNTRYRLRLNNRVWFATPWYGSSSIACDRG